MPKFRGSMIVHSDVEYDHPKWRTDAERRREKKRNRSGSRRRMSHSSKSTPHESPPNVYSTLMSVIFVVSNIRPAAAQHAFEVLASFTSDERRPLTEDDVIVLEDVINAMDHRIDHVFLPWVQTPSLQDRAHDYLDIPFLVSTITHIGHDAVMRASIEPDMRRGVTVALTTLHTKLGIPPVSRRVTV